MREEARIRTLLALISLGAHRRFVPVSTSEVGNVLGLTQQAASIRLLALEGEGLIERRSIGGKIGVHLTTGGLDLVSSLYSDLKSALEPRKEFLFKGRIFSGLKEGAYYIGLKGYRKQFTKNLGFDPYPGTLNLKLTAPEEIEQKRALCSMPGIAIEGFADRSRSYGPAKAFRATIDRVYPGAALVIERTHYDDTVLELISPINLRRRSKLNDGDELSVVVMLDG